MTISQSLLSRLKDPSLATDKALGEELRDAAFDVAHDLVALGPRQVRLHGASLRGVSFQRSPRISNERFRAS